MLSEENKAHLRNSPTGVAINCDKITFRFDELEWLMNAVRQEERERVLDAASEYMTGQYGIRALSHPVDRERVLARIRQAKDAGQ